MFKALIIGCGNIGSDYDFNNDEVTTHAKAFSISKNIEFSVADLNKEKAKKVAARYNIPFYTSLNRDTLSRFDIISVCTNTQFHFEYLKTLLSLREKLVICEKPIVSSLSEISQLKKMKPNPNGILVNYIRRFQPGFKILKKRLTRLLQQEIIHRIIIRYQRGILNNGSHALDILSFLLDSEIDFKKFQLISKEYDVFEYDPTITANFLLKKVPVMLVGYTGLSYSIFEIDIYLGSWKICIEDSGDTIRYFKAKKGELSELEVLKQQDVMKNYMIPVVDQAIKCLKKKEQTNFNSALKINEQILKLISKI